MDGAVGEEPEEGLFDYDTRIVSWRRTTVAGREPIGVAAPSLTSEAWRAILAVRLGDGDADGARLPQDALEVAIERRVGRGMDERLRIANHSMVPRRATLRLELGADFVDVMEVTGERRHHGRFDTRWDGDGRTLEIRYRCVRDGRPLERGVRVVVGNTPVQPTVRPLRRGVPRESRRFALTFPIRLAPRERAEVHLTYQSLVDGAWRTPPSDEEAQEIRAERDQFRLRRPAIDAGPVVGAVIAQAADDLLALRNQDIEDRTGEWILNAGVPGFTGFYGRDSLTAGVQAALLGTEFLAGAIARAASTQGQHVDDFTEEQPGRMVHEMRRGPLSDLGIRPHARYYGSVTTGSAFVLALSELWHWTGDEDLIRHYRPNAEAALRWAAECGDLNGDGLIEYQRRSPEGLKNQGWKDSGEAIRYPDGGQVEDPIAVVEEQAFHFAALQRMAELLVTIGEDDQAEACLRRAATIRQLVEERFWMEDEGTYALALDADGRQVRSVASNPLHLLATGMASQDRARRVAQRLLEPDLFNGWGIRTLSAAHPSYNPFSYHLGGVWPVETAALAAGLKRYGFDEEVERVVTALFAAAGHCHMGRLPEVFSGHGLDETDVPTTYPGAKSPQAWTSATTIQLIQVMLGLQPFAAANVLGLIRPRLPSWLPELTVHRLRIGEATIDVRFRREDDGSASHDIQSNSGGLRLIELPPPHAPAVGVGENLARLGLKHLPGRWPKTVRIATGALD